MAVTRLERKGRKNKAVAKKRVNTMKQLNALPSIKNIDVEAIKAEFANKKAAPAKKEEPKAEAKVEEVAEVAVETAEEKPKKKAPAKKPAAKKPAVKKAATKKEDKNED